MSLIVSWSTLYTIHITHPQQKVPIQIKHMGVIFMVKKVNKYYDPCPFFMFILMQWHLVEWGLGECLISGGLWYAGLVQSNG